MAYGKDATNHLTNKLDVNNKKLTNLETKTADAHKIVKNSQENATSLSLSSSKNYSHDTQQQDNQQKQLNKCMSLNESGKEQTLNRHQSACPTNSNPNDSSTLNRPVRNCFDAIFTLETNKSHIILISNDRNELCVYNLKSDKFARTLRNVNRPKNVQLIDEFKAVVLCDRELMYLDFDKAKLITKLKGVMYVCL